MHIILGMLGTLVTILWLLHRLAEMGIDLGGLNPWLWRRRRNWRQKYEGNPVFAVESPLEVTALLVTATAKADGDMSAEDKRQILEIFEREFQLSEEDAAGLLIASTHLLGRGDEVRSDLGGVLAASLENFSRGQAESAISLVEQVANWDSGPTQLQSDLVSQVHDNLMRAHSPKGKWD